MRLHIGICGMLLAIAILGCAESPAPQSSEKKSEVSTATGNSLDAGNATETKPDRDKPAADQGGPQLIGPGVSGPSDAAKPTHVVSIAAEYYTTGPQQGRPPDGKFEAGTNVTLIESAGSYSRVRTSAGDEAYVATDALKPLTNDADAPANGAK